MIATGSPLERLQQQTGCQFDALTQARARTAQRLAERGALLADVAVDANATVVLMGSWGRHELTGGSDDDYVVLVRGVEQAPGAPPPQPSVEAVAACFERPPSGKGPFAGVVHSADLLRVGLEDDTNANLTRRMLLVLESVAACNPQVLAGVRRDVIHDYLSDALKDRRPPRFLLNDLVRYWRTIGVDFVAKDRERGGRGWGLRNAKLRTSRKLLFASGLLPVLRCHEHAAHEIAAFLEAQFALPPADRVADAFLHYDASAEGAAALAAYDAFLALIDDPATRAELHAIDSRSAADASPSFAEVARLGATIEQSLLALLFGPQLARTTQRFTIF